VSGGAQDIRSLAVLPFANRAPSVEHDYLGTGLADVLNASLARASSLEVRVPRSGTVEAADSPAAMGRALGVDAVVSGAYEVRGDAVTVTYAVTDVRRDVQLAGNSLALALGDLLGARERLATEIVGLLRGEDAAVRAQVAARPTDQNAALQDFLHAAYEVDQFWLRPSAERLQLAERHLLLAVEKDPNFSLALVTLAKLRWVSAFYGYGDGGRELDAAVVAADRAVAIDPTLGEAHAARALVEFQRGALDSARARLRMAAAQSPNAALVHYAAGFYFMGRGLAAESIAAFQRAQQLEPDLVRRELGFAYQYAGNLEQAQLQYRDDLTRHPGDLTTMKSLAFVLLGLNRVDEAAPLVAEAERLSAHDRGVRLLSVFLGVRRGAMGVVTPWLNATRAEHWNDGGSCANVAAVLAAAGRSDEAVLWLKRAGEVAMRSYPYVAESPYFLALRTLPEFGAYAATLEQEWRTSARAEEQDPLLAPRLAQ
jgi:serine/threonine-protein kinase